MVLGFQEAETFKNVATASLSNEYCSFSWARKKIEFPFVVNGIY